MTCIHQWQDASSSKKPDWVCAKCKILYSALKRLDDDIQNYVRPWKGLTKDEVREIVLNLPIAPTGHLQGTSSLHDFARTIEDKLKDRNT
jgi:phosphoserine phosphatase